MKVVVKPSVLSGHITVPGSKSHTMRALILAMLSDGKCIIKNPLESDDTNTAFDIISLYSKSAAKDDGQWIVHGGAFSSKIKDENDVARIFSVGNSGSLLYFLPPVFATTPNNISFSGDESVCSRPVGHLLQAMEQAGALILTDSKKETAPFTFCGPIKSCKIVTEGKLSQYISGFMMAGTLLSDGIELELTNPQETPYLTMTQQWLELAGANVEVSADFKHIKVLPKNPLNAFTATIPSDWESAAFPLVAAQITKSKIVIDNLDQSGSQGDSQIVQILEKMKTYGTSGLDETLKKEPLVVALAPIPDAICALSVAAAYSSGTTIFTNVDICRKKETDRVKAMVCELSKLGVVCRDTGDTLVVEGGRGFANAQGYHGGTVESYKDHRIAMALFCFALGLKAGESVIINDAECCSVSFPDFYKKMKQIGANFEYI